MSAQRGSWSFWDAYERHRQPPPVKLLPMIYIQGQWVSLLEWIYTPFRAKFKEIQIWKNPKEFI